MNFLTNTGVYVVEPSVIDGLAYNCLLYTSNMDGYKVDAYNL